MEQNKVLLVLDTQENMFDDEFHVYNGKQILEIINSLARKARSASAKVIYVRNNGNPGEPDEPGTPGWEIHAKVVPQKGDTVFDKSSPDAFEDTELRRNLKAHRARKLVIVGMQTEMCVAETCRKAVELGYEVTLVEDGHTTFD